MYLWIALLLLAPLVQMRPGELKLKPGSEDNLENREKVKNILSRMKVKKPHSTTPKTVTPRSVFSDPKPAGKSEPQIKPPVAPKPASRISLPLINKNVSEWMHEGDMMLTVDQAESIAAGHKAKRAATTVAANYWDVNTPIYYIIDQSIQNDPVKLPLVKQAVQFWQQHTCLNFQNGNGPNALDYYIGSGCWSYVGKQGWATQQVSIGNGCESLGTVCHETMHALGFYHEQSRYDRDQYVTINLDNIDPSLQYNFVEMTPQTSNNLGVPFDYGSVMEYDAYAFATDSSIETIIPMDTNYLYSMGQREAPSFSDIVSVNNLYNCSSQCSSTPNCQNSGIVNSKNCNQCLCPKQFTGATCTQLTKGSAPSCNSQTLQATTSWQTFNGTAGDPSSYTALTSPTDCYWLIQAPAGKKIQFEVTQTSMCQDQCLWQSFEINLGNFLLGGMVLCCETSMFTSTSNQISVRGIVNYNQLRVSFKYRIA